jgi:hypothetical protein
MSNIHVHAKGIAVDDMAALIAEPDTPKDPNGNDPNFHAYSCRCDECRRWWRDNGPDPWTRRIEKDACYNQAFIGTLN